MNSLSPTSILFNDIEALHETSALALNSSSPTNGRISDTSADERGLTVIALRTHREKEKLRRRKQRERVKDELEGLRRTKDDLSLQLKNLKLAKQARRSPGEEYSFWKKIALMRREERLRSETEQRRLTATIKSQASYVENLRGFFHPATLKNATPGSVSNSTSVNPQFGPSDAPLFTSLLQKVDACYALLDDILNACGVHAIPLGIVQSTHWRDGSGEVEYHQNLHKFEQSCDLETAQQSCWEAFDFPQHQCDREVYGGMGNAENTVAFRYRMIRTLAPSATVSVVQRLVARRFVEQDRVACIWKTYTEGEGIFRGMHSETTGWSCLQPLPDGSGTLGEVCIRQYPLLFNVLPSAATAFQQCLLAILDEDKDEMMTAIQNTLSRCIIP